MPSKRWATSENLGCTLALGLMTGSSVAQALVGGVGAKMTDLDPQNKHNFLLSLSTINGSIYLSLSAV